MSSIYFEISRIEVLGKHKPCLQGCNHQHISLCQRLALTYPGRPGFPKSVAGWTQIRFEEELRFSGYSHPSSVVANGATSSGGHPTDPQLVTNVRLRSEAARNLQALRLRQRSL